MLSTFSKHLGLSQVGTRREMKMLPISQSTDFNRGGSYDAS